MILNEARALASQTTGDNRQQETPLPAHQFVDDPDASSDSDADVPLSRRRRRREKKFDNIKSFNFDEKASSSRRRILLTAADATSDLDSDSEEVDTEAAEIILKRSTNFDNMATDDLDRAFYRYEGKDQALRLVKDEPSKYKQCIIEFETHETAQAVCQHDNSVYTLNTRYNCGTAYTGDECVVEVLETTASKTYARVIAIVERAEPIKYRRFICEPDEFEPYGMMRPIDKVNPKIYIVPKCDNKMFLYSVDERTEECVLIRSEKIKDVLNLNARMYLVVVLDWTPKFKYPRGVVTEVLEPAGSLTSGLRLLSLLYGLRSDVEEGYAQHHLDKEALGAFKDKLAKQVKDMKRIDMSEVLTFTIDPEMSLDLDDAISFEKIEFEKKIYFKIGKYIKTGLI